MNSTIGFFEKFDLQMVAPRKLAAVERDGGKVHGHIEEYQVIDGVPSSTVWQVFIGEWFVAEKKSFGVALSWLIGKL